MVYKQDIKDLLKHSHEMFMKHPFKSMRFIFTSCVSGFLLFASIGALYPVLVNLLEKESENPSKLNLYIMEVLSFFALEDTLGNTLLLFMILTALSSVIYMLGEIDKGLFLKQLRNSLYEKAFRQVTSMSWVSWSRQTQGNFQNVMRNNVVHYVQLYFYILLVIGQVIMVAFFIAFIALSNVKMLGLMLFLLLGGAVVFALVFKISSILGRHYTKTSIEFEEEIINIARAFKSIKAGGVEKKLLPEFMKKANEISRNTLFTHSLYGPLQIKILEFLAAGTLSLYIYFAIEVFFLEVIQVMLAVAVLIRALPLSIEVVNSISRACIRLPSVRKYEELTGLGEKEDEDAGLKIGEIKEIEFREVSVVYPGGKVALSDFSCKFRKNRIAIIMGESGKGKTTVLDVACGLVAPESGRVIFNDANFEDCSTSYIKTRIGYLTQEHFIFSGTLRANLIWGIRGEIGDEEIDRVIRLSQLSDFVEEHGLDYDIMDNGKNLSGGQKQRIAIARLLLKKVDFILMDEPTSALDETTENEFISNLVNLKSDIGIVMVTHKKALLSIADDQIDI